MASHALNGENFMWAMRTESYLEALGIWEAIQKDYEVLPLPINPPMAQLKIAKTRKTKYLRQRHVFFHLSLQ